MADHHDKFHPAVDRIAMEIVTHLSPMCLQLDPLEEQLGMLSLGGRGQQAVTNHFVHLALHSHWTVLSVLYRLVPVIGKLLQSLFENMKPVFISSWGSFIPASIVPGMEWSNKLLW